MFENMTEQEAKSQILELVGEYCDKFTIRKRNLNRGTGLLTLPEYMIKRK